MNCPHCQFQQTTTTTGQLTASRDFSGQAATLSGELYRSFTTLENGAKLCIIFVRVPSPLDPWNPIKILENWHFGLDVIRNSVVVAVDECNNFQIHIFK